jgi:hypothetical protein
LKKQAMPGSLFRPKTVLNYQLAEKVVFYCQEKRPCPGKSRVGAQLSAVTDFYLLFSMGLCYRQLPPAAERQDKTGNLIPKAGGNTPP